MEISLNQNEIYAALARDVRRKLNLDNSVQISISLTNARAPKGHSAQVVITYPETDDDAQFTAAESADESVSDAQPVQQEAPAPAQVNVDALIGVKTSPSDDLFGG